jgi:LacI family transcriptional regulator
VLQGVADYLEHIAPWSIHVKHDTASQFSEDWIKSWRGDGIIAYISNLALAEKLCKSKIPVVDVAGLVELNLLSQVIADDHAIGALVGEHFLERQFRHFAYVGPGDVLPDELRFAGFVDCVGADKCVRYIHPRLGSSLSSWEKAQQKMSIFLKKLPKPVALMAYSDIQAREVLDACDRGGLSVPDEVAVVGVDNDQELCRLSRVPLSSVASNPRRIGYMAAQLISKMIKGETSLLPASRIVIAPLYVVTRFSSDVTAVADVYVARALSYIQRHASDDIGISDVARAVELPRRSLYRRFAAALQRTPHEELQRARFERVRRLLTETELTIDEVAELSGFQSGSYLCNCFKREYGVTISDFRNSYQNKPCL